MPSQSYTPFRLLADNTIRRIVAASDIVEIVGGCVPLKRTGATFSTLCPFHQEKSPSFIVTPARQFFKCFGCGVGGDVIRFVMLHEGVSFVEAIRYLAGRVGIMLDGVSGSTGNRLHLEPGKKSACASELAKVLRLPPDLHLGSHPELRTVAAQRGLSVAGLELASERGLLWFGSPRGLPAWIVTDQKRVNAQARRMDGARWEHLPSAPKAYTLPGSQARWCIGAKEASGFAFVVITEGGPDLLAAHHFIVVEGREPDVAALGMMGACNDHLESALQYLANKRVRIFPHTDPAGQAAAARWAEQLERVGCEVDAFSFDGLRRVDGGAVNDLNDFALVDADDFETERADLEGILPE